MADHSQLLLLSITSFFLFISFSSSDDASVMSKLSASISPVPSSWKTEHNFCLWNDIACDESGRVIAILIASKSLTGTLPSELNTLSQLQRLSLGNNSLSGELPTLANLTRLVYAFLNSNNFTSIPSNFFLGLTNLKNFSISDNPHLSPWSIPYDLTQSTNLEAFEASNSNIAGSIPDIFDNFLNLRDLRLSYNNITGTLPATFGGSKIQNLWLDNQIQGLSGTIDVIASMTKLNQVWLQANAFTGVIPDLSKCIHLFNLQLRDNRLTGLVPNSLTSLRKLANITLQNNKLQGPVPIFESGVEFYISANSFCLPMPGNCDPQVTALLEVSRALGYPMSLAESWHGNNACDHWPFITCDPSGENVTSINFSNMKFSGTISPSLGNLTSLKSLSLKDNNLTGSIPEILVSLTDLELLDLSNNNLSGRIPKFLTTVTILLDNNPLIGRDVDSGNIKPPTYASNSSVSGWRPPRHVLAGMVVGIVISLFIFGGIVWYVCYYKSYDVLTKLHSQVRTHHNQMHIPENGNQKISIQVLEQVTDNFSERNVLGRGGFGVVYKGQFHDGSMIAVKRMKLGRKGMNEFQAEIEVLTKVRHRHLVALLGYCSNGSERLLVYATRNFKSTFI